MNTNQTPAGGTVAGLSVAGGSALSFEEYQPELWTVCKDDIYHAIDALESGLENTRDNLTRHDAELGRTTRRNEMWAKQLERDIESMERIIDRLRKYTANTMPRPNVEMTDGYRCPDAPNSPNSERR